VTIATWVNYENDSLGSEVISGAIRDQYRTHPYTIPGVLGEADTRIANNTTLDFSWSTPAGSPPPIIYEGGPSFIVLPETTGKRVTDWSDEGRPTDKLVKGIVLEVDTGGVAKNINVQGDGSTQTSISIQSTGRQVLEFTWAQFRARLLRLDPSTVAPMILYSYRWIFDEEPLAVKRWETQEQDNGIKGWAMLFWSNITIACFSTVTLTILCYDQSGNVFNTLTATIASTGGQKRKVFVPFAANKSVLRKYTLTASIAFYLYREESSWEIQAWDRGEVQKISPVGDDALDLVRSMHDAGLGASRSGGGGGQ
jgi:hypothetical protein